MTFSYQKNAKMFLAKNKRGAIFLPVGMGKTKIMLDKIVEIVEEGKKILIIAPVTVARGVWSSEAQKFYPELKVSVCVGSKKQRGEIYKANHDVLVITRDSTYDFFTEKMDKSYDCVILDESSSFKTMGSKRTKGIMKVSAEYRYLLSATPFQKLEDLWTQFYFLDGGERLGSTITKFRSLYFNKTLTYMGSRSFIVYEEKPGAMDEVLNKIQDIVFSTENPHNIPEETIYVDYDMSRQAREIYDDLLKSNILRYSDESVSVLEATGRVMKLTQICNGAVYKEDKNGYDIIHNLKAKSLRKLIDKTDDNVIVVYRFKFDIDLIKSEVPEAVIYNNKILDDWNEGKIKVLLVHPRSAGYGINLQHGGSTLIWYSLTYSLEEYIQTNGRLLRPGQSGIVRIYIMICSNSIESGINRILKGKENIVEYFNSFLLDFSK